LRPIQVSASHTPLGTVGWTGQTRSCPSPKRRIPIISTSSATLPDLAGHLCWPARSRPAIFGLLATLLPDSSSRPAPLAGARPMIRRHSPDESMGTPDKPRHLIQSVLQPRLARGRMLCRGSQAKPSGQKSDRPGFETAPFRTRRTSNARAVQRRPTPGIVCTPAVCRSFVSARSAFRAFSLRFDPLCFLSNLPQHVLALRDTKGRAGCSQDSSTTAAIALHNGRSRRETTAVFRRGRPAARFNQYVPLMDQGRYGADSTRWPLGPLFSAHNDIQGPGVAAIHDCFRIVASCFLTLDEAGHTAARSAGPK